MNILYIHGFKSQFKEQSAKVQALNKLGKVFGVTLDYTNAFKEIKNILHKFVLDKDIDLVVGTSLGGYYSSIIGDGFTFTGDAYTLKKETITTYPGFALEGCGLILLDRGDKLINSEETLSTLENFYGTRIFEGGNHRFEHINESLREIEDFFERPSLVYGFGADDD
ncbi:YqiA/YcfP family alpha/beta fold hydrolase [Methyloprofundus sp.]|uniref:YqiA/YcfP family alpha/beta fold hydrolase n=1 Tax=Methyloprofundus sp. TaxID=2020875 RepID=UPI003D0A3B18